MLDLVTVFSKTGAVLWRQAFAPLKTDPVGAVIHSILLEDRASSQELYQDAVYSVKWSVDNEMDLVVVAVYQRVIQLSYIDELLARCRDEFVELLRGVSEPDRCNVFPCKPFDAKFDGLLKECEAKAVSANQQRRKSAAPRSFAESKKFSNTRLGNKQSSAIAADNARAEGGGGARASLSKKKGAEGAGLAEASEGGKGKKGKEARSWDGEKPAEGGKKMQLDYSKKGGNATSRVNVFKGGAVNLDESFGVGAEVEADDDDDFGAATVAAASPTKKAGGMFSVFQGLVGNKPLERSALDPMMETLHSRLIEKNVASDIGGQICESVCSSLLGKQIGSFGSLRATVRDAMEKTLTRILTPSRRVDLLAACTAARAEKRPYTIVFVGVNGVGKSTSLSKVAYYLKSNGFTPMLCACDTFRAGAVEQLRVHAQSLDLPLFEKGYGRDASGIAADGIKYAAQMGYDVVMVDTAGRMQDNEPLMRSLSKLVTLNSPDLVLFVGEALVGNEAVDQVTGFNTALSEYSASKLPRIIDGIMLTKFDTIDDKVGAALSLVYTTGKPIVFVGVGQTYTDIRNLNVDHCVRALLKG